MSRPSRNLPARIADLPQKTALLLIEAYQHTLSPDHGPLRHLSPYGYCRHAPTCSQYAKEMILQHGAVLGTLRGLKRLLTCHPWRTPDPRRIMEVSQDSLRSAHAETSAPTGSAHRNTAR